MKHVLCEVSLCRSGFQKGWKGKKLLSRGQMLNTVSQESKPKQPNLCVYISHSALQDHTEWRLRSCSGFVCSSQRGWRCGFFLHWQSFFAACTLSVYLGVKSRAWLQRNTELFQEAADCVKRGSEVTQLGLRFLGVWKPWKYLYLVLCSPDTLQTAPSHHQIMGSYGSKAAHHSLEINNHATDNGASTPYSKMTFLIRKIVISILRSF